MNIKVDRNRNMEYIEEPEIMLNDRNYGEDDLKKSYLELDSKVKTTISRFKGIQSQERSKRRQFEYKHLIRHASHYTQNGSQAIDSCALREANFRESMDRNKLIIKR